MDQKMEELKHRVQARRKELEARLEQARADAHGRAGDAVDEVRARLQELERTIKDGWESLGDEAVARLNDWLRKE